ncbi:MAG: DUF2118 domain-containing protein [Elusimicrobiota bacterium]
MNFEFKLPDIGEGLVEGEIVKWFVKVGDRVAENQPLVSVLTDKAEVEIPSPKSGTIVKLHGKPGEKIKVHAPLAELALADAPSEPGTAPQAAETFVFNLPDIGEGLVEGELVKWLVKEGARVVENEPLAAVLTDKAEVEIPSPKTGTIVRLHAQPGQKVKVHGPLVTLAISPSAGSSSAPTPGRIASSASPRPEPAPARAARPASGVLATPMVRRMAKERGIDIGLISGSGPQGRVLAADVTAPRTSGTVRATPAVKSLAAELNVDLSLVAGTGPGGRVSEIDVRAARPAPRPIAAASPAAPRHSEDSVIPFAGIRRKIAEKMQHSKRTVAHVTHMDECDMTAVQLQRTAMKSSASKRGVKLTFLPFVIRALIKALDQFPAFNASLDEAASQIVLKRRRNIGIAVAASQGLVVPNIKGAQDKDLWSLASEIASLAEKVRANKIDVAALQDGTFTITNIGPIGGLFATPIVNHPEVAILGLMKMQPRPVVREGKIVAREMMNLVLSFDHRVVDGADAANFMNTLINHLENPQTLL